MLLYFSRSGALPLGKMGDRLQIHRTAITHIVDRLVRDGFAVRAGSRIGPPDHAREADPEGPADRRARHQAAERRAVRHHAAAARRARGALHPPARAAPGRGRLHRGLAGPAPRSPSGPRPDMRPCDYRNVSHLDPVTVDTQTPLDGWAAAYRETPERDAAFMTLSGDPVHRSTPRRTSPDPAAAIGCRDSSPTRAACTRACTAAGCGRCASSRASAPRRRPTSASATCSSTGRPASRRPSTCRRSWATTPTTPSLGEVGREGVAIDTVADMETLFAGIDLGAVSVSMTINAPAAIMLAFYVVAAGRQGVPPSGSAARSRRTSSRSTSPRRSGASRSTRRCACWATSSSGRRRRCRAGTRCRSPATTSARRERRRPRSSRSRSRTASPTSSRRSTRGLDVDDFAPAAELLLQRPDRLLRGDRQVPRGAPDLGARDARHLRREGPALVAHALPHPDRGRVADRAAAAQQHRAHRDRGAGRRAGRHAVAAHQLLRRGARAAHRGGGADRAAHPADHRPRDRGDQHDRPAGRLATSSRR